MIRPGRARTGVDGLDVVLDGGLLRDRLYLIDGDPGAGKTTLAMHFLRQGLADGERCLYITLSETADELRDGAASHGWSLDGIEIVEIIGDGGDLDGDRSLTMFHPSEVELSETTQRVIDAVERTNPQRLVFDSLSELRLLAQHSLRYRRQILALKQYLAGRHCTSLLLDDRTAEGQDLQLQSIAHGVIALGHEAPPYGPARRQLRVVKFRGSGFRTGNQDMTLVRGGLRVFPRVVALEHGTAFKREAVPSGIAGLDALFGGGIDRGTATLFLGPAGSGKSTVALQYACAAAARGDHAAIFTFEESRALLLDRAAKLGIQVREGTGPGQVNVQQIDPTQVVPGEFAHMVRAAVERDGARIVVIDSLNGYINAMHEEKALAAQLHELLSYLGNHGVATFLVAAQVGMFGNSARTMIDTSYLADAIAMFRLYEHAGRVRKAVSVLKKRSGAHDDTIRELHFDAAGVHVGAGLTALRGVMTGVPTERAVPAEDELVRGPR